MSTHVALERPLTGLVDPAAVHPPPGRVPAAVLERLQAVQDLSATVSDVLDALGVEGAVGASELSPIIADSRIIGTAVTVRKAPRRRAAAIDAAGGTADMGEIEGVNQAEPGDVLVLQGLPGVSAMGGLVSTMAKRQGAAGAIVDGGVRDVGQARSLDFPIWSTHVTPVTGKWRSEVVEVNGPVSIQGRVVKAGDLVIADETGVVFVSRELVTEVVRRVEEVGHAEEGYRAALESELPLHELIKAQREGSK
jgi:4-hydroxy-4-methyl-2-oxoglutarate aldolase